MGYNQTDLKNKDSIHCQRKSEHVNSNSSFKRTDEENNQKQYLSDTSYFLLCYMCTHPHTQILTVTMCLASSTLLLSSSSRKRSKAGLQQEKWFASRSAIALTATATSTYSSGFDFHCWASVYPLVDCACSLYIYMHTLCHYVCLHVLHLSKAL